jgi:transcriptional regulator with XRE-family HTH domain
MIPFSMLPPENISIELSKRAKNQRLRQNLTLAGLAQRSGVPLGTLKKFEQTGQIALVSFLRLAVALKDEAALENLLREQSPETLDEVLQNTQRPKRGRIT